MIPNDLLKMLQDPAASSDLYTYLRDHLIASFDLKPYQENAANYPTSQVTKAVDAEIQALNYIVMALSKLTEEVAKVDSDEEAAHISQEYQKPIIDKILYGELMPSMLREKLPNLAPPKAPAPTAWSRNPISALLKRSAISSKVCCTTCSSKGL